METFGGSESPEEMMEQLYTAEFTTNIDTPDMEGFEPTDSEKQLFFEHLINMADELECDISYGHGTDLTVLGVSSSDSGQIILHCQGAFYSEDFEASMSFDFDIIRS